ncbi:MAG: hypothetical protein JW931_02580 [Methanomicrobiaceae archaeon]|nr:hypothetical protein [Methanomicrobiaceae archaeon]
MKWIKKGLIIEPQKDIPWMNTHAMVPFAETVDENRIRVYFSGRDEKNRSHVTYAELDIENPENGVEYARKPVFTLGDLGCFDDNGVTPSWVINHGGEKYLYYIGWNKGSTVRMHLVAGLAVSKDGGKSFTRVKRVPILDRTDEEPLCLQTAPCVMIEDGLWRMWYVSGIKWIDPDTSKYNIKYAESENGVDWVREGIVCIDLSEDEKNLARPCVVKEDGIYKMWYSYKKGYYRIGYAESPDGINWTRKDDLVGIDVSDSGWDSQMVEYAFVFTHKGRKYMLYNGNDYGKGGIGYAILDES